MNNSSLRDFGVSVSTGALCKDGLKLVVLLSLGKKPADPNDLLEAFFLADLKDDLLGITKLVGWESVVPIRSVMLSSLEAREGVGTLSTGPHENPNEVVAGIMRISDGIEDIGDAS